EAANINAVIAKDEQSNAKEIVLKWKAATDNNDKLIPVDSFELKGISQQNVASTITGTDYVQWTGKPTQQKVYVYGDTLVNLAVTKPKNYWVPGAWTEVVGILTAHGIKMDKINHVTTIEVELYHITDPEFNNTPFEGHFKVKAKPIATRMQYTFPKGSFKITTDQPLGDLLALLLEPQSAESLFQ